MPLVTLSRSMLNRLTLPQLKDLASQLRVPVAAFPEKSWIVEDILEESHQPIDLSQVHDALLRVERATDSPTIRQARQLIKEHCFTTHDSPPTLGKSH